MIESILLQYKKKYKEYKNNTIEERKKDTNSKCSKKTKIIIFIIISLLTFSLSVVLICLHYNLLGVLISIGYSISCRIASNVIDNNYLLDSIHTRNKLSIIKNILENENLFSEKCINQLIESCNLKITQSKPDGKILNTINNFFNSFVLPILMLFIGFYLDHIKCNDIKTLQDVLNYVLIILVLGMLAVGVEFFFHSICINIFNKKYYDYTNLKEKLYDVKLIYFSDEIKYVCK